MENSKRINLNGATHAEALYNPNDSTTAAPSLQSVYNPPRYHGEVGWICPICGRGNAPSTAYCNCNMTKPDIVYANGGTALRSILDDAIPCRTKTNEYITTSVSSNYSDSNNTSLINEQMNY